MNRKELRAKTARTVPAHVLELNQVILQAIQDTKGVDMVKLDLTAIHDSSTDFFIICSGTSTTHIAGIVDNIRRSVSETLGLDPNHTEGKNSRQWMLLDYFSTIVHVFTPDKRIFYGLENLWSDAQVTKYPNP